MANAQAEPAAYDTTFNLIAPSSSSTVLGSTQVVEFFEGSYTSLESDTGVDLPIFSYYSTEYASYTESTTANGGSALLTIDYTLNSAVIPVSGWVVLQVPRRNADYLLYGATSPYDSLFLLSGTTTATL